MYHNIACWQMMFYCKDYGHPLKIWNLKFWADVADKICFCSIYKFGIGIWFLAVQWRQFLHRASVVRAGKEYGRQTILCTKSGFSWNDERIKKKYQNLWQLLASGFSFLGSQVIHIFGYATKFLNNINRLKGIVQ